MPIRLQNPVDHHLTGLTRLLVVSLLFAFSLNASALEFQCETPGDVRYLRVDIPGEENLCEVSVKYTNTGERRVMWYAANDSLFCSAKAYELRDKYQNLWDFDCRRWPDRDGIDRLSPTHRGILDKQLKSLIAQGKAAAEPFQVTAVKATASTPLDGQPGMLAIQYFRSNGDLTQVISDTGDTWQVFATIDDMATHITGDAPVSTALISSVTDTGALELSTAISNNSTNSCFGKQVLMVEPGNQLRARTPHQVVCTNPDIAVGDAN